MIPELRRRFNEQWTPEAYRQFSESLAARSGAAPGFRCSETPLFLPGDLLETMVRYGRELYGQLAANAEYRAASEAAIPEKFRVPNEDEHPLFVQADFGFVREAGGRIAPKLVEIQGFPSLYAFQVVLAAQYQESYRLSERVSPNLTPFLGGLDAASYDKVLRDAILGGHEPEQVVLLELDPYAQKTLCDFIATQKRLGLTIADVGEVRKRGRKLYIGDVEIRRIYNRVIVDELLRRDIQMDFRFTDDLDVEWAGHPNWFFRLSKFSLPWFRHESVPETFFLDEVRRMPEDLENYVLKPLYSFAGLGVKIGPSNEELAAVPDGQRHEYVLQKKMDFVPTIDTPGGPTKAEVRIMYIHNGTELAPVLTVVRTGRGKMMGVDFNRNLDWVGASAGLHFQAR